MENKKYDMSFEELAGILKRRKENESDYPYLLFLGAGASLASGNPTMRELIDQFLIDMSVDKDLLKKIDDFEKLNIFSVKMSSLTKYDRYDWFTEIFKEAKPSIGYCALCSLLREGYFDIVLTTNIDNLFEEGIRKDIRIPLNEFIIFIRGKDPEVLLTEHLSLIKPRYKLIKLHGDHQSRCFYFTPDETFQFPPQIECALKNLLANRDIIMIGNSVGDIDFIRCMEKNSRRIVFVNPNPPKTKEYLALKNTFESFVEFKGFEGEFDNFFLKLSEHLKVELYSFESEVIEKLNKVLELLTSKRS